MSILDEKRGKVIPGLSKKQTEVFIWYCNRHHPDITLEEALPLVRRELGVADNQPNWVVVREIIEKLRL